MDTRLLRHYENELAYLRDMGGEFAQAYPKIAARLGMEGLEVLDPYVERLLEGVAFLTARVQLELELQYPNFTSNLLEIVYPHYLAPLPSMMIAHFEPDTANSAVKEGFVMPRHTQLRARPVEGGQTSCIFRTAMDMTLWPLEVSEAEYIDSRGGLVAAGVSRNTQARAGIRLRLKRTDGGKIAELPMDRLTLHLTGQSGQGWGLHEMLAADSTGLVARSTDRRADWTLELPKGDVEQRGFEPDEAMLPTPAASFDGYRLLQEYFAMPERFHFVDLRGLRPGLQRAKGSDVDIYILLKDGNKQIGDGLTKDAFMLHAVPAVNLFPRRFDRVHVSHADVEQHVVVSRTAPLDYEVYRIESVTGISGEGKEDVIFRPFYSATDLTAAGDSHPAYYSIHRQMRQRTERERLRGVRTSYLGAELYVSLVDASQAPYPADITQLAITGLATNRDLPLLLSSSSKGTFSLPDGGPVLAISTPVPPTRPRPTIAQGDIAWRLISHLSLNYISIAQDDETGSEALRELVGIYAPQGDRVIAKQLEGVVGVHSRPIVRRMTDEVLSTAVRGIEITLTFDESFFEGASAYLLGAVLERFFRKYVSINSFTETVVRTQQRGEIARWKPAAGLGRMI